MKRLPPIDRLTATTAVIALAAGSVLALGVSAAAAPTVITSTGFQDGTLGDWSPNRPSGAEVVSLGKVLQVQNRAADWQGVALPLALEEGVTYDFSMLARLASDAPATTGMRFVVNAGSEYHWVGDAAVNADDWTTVEGTYTATATGLATVFIGSADAADGAPYGYLLDDIRVSSGGTELTAADFEDGTLGGWAANSSATAAVVDDNALAVVARTADWHGIELRPTLAAGTAYTLSMRIRLDASAGAQTTSARFVVSDEATFWDWVGNTEDVSADGWTTVTGTYTPTADGQLQVFIGTAAIEGLDEYGYLVDDIRITTDSDSTDPGTDPSIVPGGAINPTTTPVSAANGSGNVVALTFDDGPNGAATTELLDYLGERDIRAVFCVIGQNIQAPGGAELLTRIVADGHVLCNHTTGYDDMGAMSADDVRADLIENLRIIRAALGDPNAQVPFFRAPNGSWGQTPAVAVSLGMQPLAVTNTIGDWATQDVEELTENLRNAITPGELVLVHDGGGVDRSGSIAATKTVVAELLADGWTFTFPVGTPPPPGRTVLSTDFEDGLDGWGPRQAEEGDPVAVELVGEPVHGGIQAAAVTQRFSQGSGIGHDVTGLLDEGVTYEFTAWVRFAAGETPGDVWLSMQRTTGGSPTFSTLGQFTGMSNSEWVQVRATFTMAAAESAYLYLETDYNGANTSTFVVDDIVVRTPEPAVIQDLTPIKDAVPFPIGVAIDSRETFGAPQQLTLRHFDQITAENHMKPEAWYDASGAFAPSSEVAALMDFARDNELRVYGHVLTWHSQTPAFFFQDSAGNPLTTSEADKQVLRDRLRTHIREIGQYLADGWGEFGGDNPLVAWDVVNEVVADSGENADGLRRSEWYRILGEEFIDLSFHYAEEVFNGEFAASGADRPVTLFINDYNTEQSGKQDRYLALVQRLLSRGVPLDGVGHQFHVSLAMPVSALESAIQRFQGLGLTQAVTELDVTTGTPVTQAKLVDQGYYYRDAFRIFRAHAADLYSVTVWGLNDSRSWRSSNGAPLVFDDALQAKPAYYGIVDDELPAPLRTANVFAADIPAAAGAANAPEWQRLPLIPISDAAAFQARWHSDRLTVLVEVEDTTPGSDAVEFQLGDTTVTLGRDGAGTATGVVAETTTGYRMVVELPLTGAAQGGTLEFDVRVRDGLSAAGWNATGVLGTLTLLESVSFTEVVQAATAPVVDGEIDAAWDDANAVATSKKVEGDGAEATVRTLWRDGRLYVLAVVADPIVDVSGSDPWIQDSIELYVDPGNAKYGSYRYDDSQIRISAANVVSFGTGDEAWQRARIESATSTIDGGYIVEVAVQIGDPATLGSFQGLDFQVNDAQGGQRIGISNWADPSGAGYQSTARWGVGQLVGPVDGPGDGGGEQPDRPTIVLEAGTVRAGDTLDVALSGFDPGATVQLVLDRPANALGGGGGIAGIAATARGALAAPVLPAVLATITIGADGTATGTVRIPADTQTGSYRLAAEVEGVFLASAQLTVLSALAGTGADISGALILALVLLATGAVVIGARARARARTRV
ncbi:endo-1,4-beta-xylanase [Salinibacterium sp. ZJ70]|uniref:endo-1,4-beta-xylanase n=1 Tax=Salinibacterium sp. ZJ70 TaxID=2708084 RepID=UPI001424486D|nr:endo-1,4-beta-xylanase [Salinibacterium sp. ZJ70]